MLSMQSEGLRLDRRTSLLRLRHDRNDADHDEEDDDQIRETEQAAAAAAADDDRIWSDLLWG